MDATRKASLEAECQRIRANLKAWEHQWNSQHGAKPSRNDIKATPDIGTPAPPVSTPDTSIPVY